MSNPFVRAMIRSKFTLTSREKASAMIRNNAESYVGLADRFDPASAMKPVTVPPMIGVDPEMRGWSFFQILEHNAIVNRSISAMVQALALGKKPAGDALIDPKTDVLPKGLSGAEQISAFLNSVDDHLALVATLPHLRGTPEQPHPIFGSFDAHKWHCMFGFHLGLHLHQARKILSLLRK